MFRLLGGNRQRSNSNSNSNSNSHSNGDSNDDAGDADNRRSLSSINSQSNNSNSISNSVISSINSQSDNISANVSDDDSDARNPAAPLTSQQLAIGSPQGVELSSMNPSRNPSRDQSRNHPSRQPSDDSAGSSSSNTMYSTTGADDVHQPLQSRPAGSSPADSSTPGAQSSGSGGTFLSARSHASLSPDEAADLVSGRSTARHTPNDVNNNDGDDGIDDDDDDVYGRTSDFTASSLFSPPAILFSPPSAFLETPPNIDDMTQEQIAALRARNRQVEQTARTPAFVHQLRGQSALADLMSPPVPGMPMTPGALAMMTPNYTSDSDSDAGSVQEPFADQVKSLNALLTSPALRLGNLARAMSDSDEDEDNDDDLRMEQSNQEMALRMLQQELAEADESILMESPELLPKTAQHRQSPTFVAGSGDDNIDNVYEDDSDSDDIDDIDAPDSPMLMEELHAVTQQQQQQQQPSRRKADEVPNTPPDTKKPRRRLFESFSPAPSLATPAAKVQQETVDPKDVSFTSPQSWIQRLGLLGSAAKKPPQPLAKSDDLKLQGQVDTNINSSSAESSEGRDSIDRSGSFPSGPITPSPPKRKGGSPYNDYKMASMQLPSPIAPVHEEDDDDIHSLDSDEGNDTSMVPPNINLQSNAPMSQSSDAARSPSSIGMRSTLLPPADMSQSIANLENSLGATPRTPPSMVHATIAMQVADSDDEVDDDINSQHQMYLKQSMNSMASFGNTQQRRQLQPRMENDNEPHVTSVASLAAAAATLQGGTSLSLTERQPPSRPTVGYLPEPLSPSTPTSSTRPQPTRNSDLTGQSHRSVGTDNAVLGTPSIFPSLPTASPSSASSEGSSPDVRATTSTLTTGSATPSSDRSHLQGERRPKEGGTWLMNILSSINPTAANEPNSPLAASPISVRMDDNSSNEEDINENANNNNNNNNNSISNNESNESIEYDSENEFNRRSREGEASGVLDISNELSDNQNSMLNSSNDDDDADSNDDEEMLMFTSPLPIERQLYPYSVQTNSTVSTPPTTMTSPSAATMSSGSVMPLTPPSPDATAGDNKSRFSTIPSSSTKKVYTGRRTLDLGGGDGDDNSDAAPGQKSRGTLMMWKDRRERRRQCIFIGICVCCAILAALVVGLLFGLDLSDGNTNRVGRDIDPLVETQVPSLMPSNNPSAMASVTPSVSFAPTSSTQPTMPPTVSQQPTTPSPTASPTILQSGQPTTTPSSHPSQQPTSAPTRSDIIVISNYEVLVENGAVEDIPADQYTGDLIAAMDLLSEDVLQTVLVSRGRRRLQALDEPQLEIPSTLVETVPVVVPCDPPNDTGRCEEWTAQVKLLQAEQAVGDIFDDFLQTSVALGRLQFYLNEVNPDAVVRILDFLIRPTFYPTVAPAHLNEMTDQPTIQASEVPTSTPNNMGSKSPTAEPTSMPTRKASKTPSDIPTGTPTRFLSSSPSNVPTATPTTLSSKSPSSTPTMMPTMTPTTMPTTLPTIIPTTLPTTMPTTLPTTTPTTLPTTLPTAIPTTLPTTLPTTMPTTMPTAIPTTLPSLMPSAATPEPTSAPTETTPEPTSRDRVVRILEDASFDGGAAMRDPTTAQNSAFQWILSNSRLDSYDDERIIQRYALATLYYSTKGDSWSRRTNWISDIAECTWYSKITTGFTCNRGDYIAVDLDFNNLDGTIPPELALLSNSLQRLDLRGGPNTFLTGKIPTELGYLTELRELVLRDNSLTGPVPTELGQLSRLTFVDISRNHLSGDLPTEIGNWKALTHLEIAVNEMEGQFPTEIGALKKLKKLYLQNNKFVGAFPSEIGHLGKLDTLIAGMNRFTGMPDELGNLYKLEMLGLEDNVIAGTIPTQLGWLEKLRSLELNNNKLTGPIPAELGDLYSTLRDRMDLSFNRLSGKIPTELAYLTRLRVLSLQHNYLTGQIPSELHELDRLTTFRLEGNDMSGEIPAEVCEVFDRTAPAFYSDCGEFQGGCPCCTFCCSDDDPECRCVHDGTPLQYLCYQTRTVVVPDGLV